MSVTIVSTPPQSAAQPPTDVANSGGNLDTGADFASLLLGQLLPVTTPAAPEIKAETTSAPSDDAPIDAASVLATLVAPSEPGRQSDIEVKDSPVQEGTSPVANSEKPSRSASFPVQSAKDRPPVGQQPLEPGAPDTSAIDEKPAKLAAPALPAAIDNAPLPTKRSAGDETSSPLSSLTATNVFGHSNRSPVNRDASLAVNTSFRDSSWSSDFNQKIVWLAVNDKQSAQLTLNPPQMGPIEVSITVDKGTATASFASASSDVREAIETALPKLREMFANAGIQLGQTNVGTGSFQQQTPDNGTNYGSSRWVSDNAILAADSAGSHSGRVSAAQQRNGMVDIFA